MRRFALGVGTLSLMFGCLGSPASGGTIRHDRPDLLYEQLGVQQQYASVGQFLGHADFPNAYDFAASGVLISEDWVLTAAHVVLTADQGLDFFIGGNEYSVTEGHVFPEFSWDPWAGNDIAVAKLSKSVPGIKPATLYRGEEEYGQIGTSVGYGATGTGLTGANLNVSFDGLEKRAGHNVIDYYWPVEQPRLIFSDFDNPDNPDDSLFGSSDPLDLEYLIAPGDSGGGLFVGDRLVGIHSIGVSVDGEINSDYGDVSGHVRVSPYVPWIENTVGARLPNAQEFTTIVNSEGFENPRYFASGLEGQGGWLHAGSGKSLATIQTAVTKTDRQAVRVDRVPNADGRWAVPVFGYPADRFVVVRWDMNVQQTSGVPFGPFFGVEVYDDNGGFGLLGSLGVDASTRDILFQHQDDGFLTETGTKVNFDEWNAFAIRLDFTEKKYSVFCNGEWLATTAFVDRALGVDEFTDADISTLAAADDAASQAATGTAYFDNFSVIEQSKLGFGDIDGSGTVEDRDLNILLSSFGQSGADLPADLDYDGYVGKSDLDLLLGNFGQSLPVPLSHPGPIPEPLALAFEPLLTSPALAPVPEPSAFVLAVIGVFGLLHRLGRRRQGWPVLCR